MSHNQHSFTHTFSEDWSIFGYLMCCFFQGRTFQKFNPLLFAVLNLLWTKIGPENSIGVVWALSEGHLWTKDPWKPLYEPIVWPNLSMTFWVMAVICQIRGEIVGKLMICCESLLISHLCYLQNEYSRTKTWEICLVWLHNNNLAIIHHIDPDPFLWKFKTAIFFLKRSLCGQEVTLYCMTQRIIRSLPSEKLLEKNSICSKYKK